MYIDIMLYRNPTWHVQTVTLEGARVTSGATIGGFWRLSFRSRKTGNLSPDISSSDFHAALVQLPDLGSVCVNRDNYANQGYVWSITFMYNVDRVSLFEVDISRLFNSLYTVTSYVSVDQHFIDDYSVNEGQADSQPNITNGDGSLSSMISFSNYMIDEDSIGWWFNERIFRVVPTNLTGLPGGVLDGATEFAFVEYFRPFPSTQGLISWSDSS